MTKPCGVEQSCCPEARHLVAQIADSVTEKRSLGDSKAFEGGLMILITASFEENENVAGMQKRIIWNTREKSNILGYLGSI